MKKLLKSPALYVIIVLLGTGAGIGASYPIPVLIIVAIVGTIITVNYIQNQTNKRTVAQMEVLGNIMNKAKNGQRSPLEKYIEGKMAERMKEIDGSPIPNANPANVIEFTDYQDIPVLPNSID